MQGWMKWRSGSPFGCSSHSKSRRHAYKSTAEKPLMGCFPGWRWESVHAYKSQIKVIAHWSLATSTDAPWVCFSVPVYSSEMIQRYARGLAGAWARGFLGWAKLGSTGEKRKINRILIYFLKYIWRAVEALELWKHYCFSILRMQKLRRRC